ncbi:MAG TPA: DNA gyrase inhibitor YacG [Propylenella sp.]
MTDGGPRDAAAKEARRRPPRACPICGRPAAEDLRPFCSRRCADIDLNRWLSGTYVIRGRDADDGEETGG